MGKSAVEKQLRKLKQNILKQRINIMSNDEFSRYNRKDIIQSIYCYSDTDILINKFDIRDNDMLSKLEADLSHYRITELEANTLVGHFGLPHFLKIHKFIFQDIYPFAGKLRAEDIWKGDTFFCKCQYIQQNLEDIFNRLKREGHLYNHNIEVFSGRITFYMAELNAIHSFREGNGRVIREYIRCLALRNGYHINWAQIDKDELLSASIRSIDRDLKPLTRCILNSIEK
jgi:cell filamentation protein